MIDWRIWPPNSKPECIKKRAEHLKTKQKPRELTVVPKKSKSPISGWIKSDFILQHIARFLKALNRKSIALKFWRLTFYLLFTAYPPCICCCLSSAYKKSQHHLTVPASCYRCSATAREEHLKFDMVPLTKSIPTISRDVPKFIQVLWLFVGYMIWIYPSPRMQSLQKEKTKW